MKNNFIKIVLSIFLSWLILEGLSAIYTFALKQNCNLKAAFVQKKKINADLLVLGPCEPLWIISPALLDKQTGLKSYNLSLSHSDFADNYLHFYFYLKNNIAPKYLLLYITPESMDIRHNTFNTYRFAEFIDDATVRNVIKENDSAYYFWSKIPFMKYAYYNNKINFDVLQGLKHFFQHRELPYYADGYEPPIQIKWDNHLEEFIELYPNGYIFQWNKMREKYLRKILELAQQNKIEVLLYESPLLNEALPYQPNRNEIISKIKYLAEEYKINFLQFQNMKIANSRKYYMSTLNLNISGSTIFNDTLGQYLKKEIILK